MTAIYPITVHWSIEDDAWIADVPDLPDCTAHGPTPHEAVAQVEAAIEAWLDAARAEGRPIPEPSSRAHQASGEITVGEGDLDDLPEPLPLPAGQETPSANLARLRRDER